MDNSTGTLQVRVTVSRAEIPVQDATVVVIRRMPSGKYDLISIQTTDTSGEVKPMKIETPPPLDSTEPGLDSHPFTECDIWAEHPDFAMLLVEGVQIFPGVTTIQNMELSPLSGTGNSFTQCGVRDISPQDL